jgi:carbon-monoxide dehydrogenase medium subunit
VYPGRFAYHLPDSLHEAVAQLERGGGDARALAGGQSLMRLMRFRYESPSHLVDLRNLALSGIDEFGGRLRIGATTTDAVIGGSAAYAHPSGDWGPALLAARATFTAVGPGGQRSIPADQFFVGSFCTSLGPADILTGIEMSGLGNGGGAYMKLHRKIGDFATVGVAVQLTVDPDGKVSDCGIGMAGVALSYVRASKAEEYLVGRTLDRDSLRRGSGIASEETHPVTDTRGSAIYKREMVKVLCRHALETAALRAGVELQA